MYITLYITFPADTELAKNRISFSKGEISMASLIQRGDIYYIQHRVNRKLKRISTGTASLQLAKEKLRQLESATLRGAASPLPTGTPIAQVLEPYVEHLRAKKTAKSAQTDIYYLRDTFGPVCEALTITSRKVGPGSRKRKYRKGQDRRCRPSAIEANCFEEISTAAISTFIHAQVQSRGLRPKTANRYREVLSALFNWATSQRGIRMKGDANPAAGVQRYKESAPEISFLTLPQIDEQLAALAATPQLQTMVAMLIYAGLRREELLWLTVADVDFATGARGIIRIRAKTVNREFWEPKKTKVNRAVPISRALRAHLDAYRPRLSNGGWYFPSPWASRWDTDNFSRNLRAANHKPRLPWTCLDFRHTFGSQLAMKGESLLKISKLMGNSPEICRRHYAALVPEEMGDSVEFGPRATIVAADPLARSA